jgi:hypothetical protein
MSRKRPTRWLLLLPSAPYLASLVLPIDSRGTVPGYVAFVICFLAGAAGSPAALLYWLPHPLLWFGLYLLDRGRIKSALYVGAAAALLAMLPVMKPDRYLEEIISSPGYVAWLVSMHLLVAAGYLGLLFPRKPDPIQRELWATESELSALRSEVRELRELVQPRKAPTSRIWELN